MLPIVLNRPVNQVSKLGTDWYPKEPIEQHTSIIWVERFQTPGEFKLRMPNISDALKQLPKGTIISLNDSGQVMMVEDHLIERDEYGRPILTVSGRSLDAFLNYRLVDGTPGKQNAFPVATDTLSIASAFIWNALCSTSPYDNVRTSGGRNPLDRVPNIISTNDSWFHFDYGTPTYYYDYGNVYDIISKILKAGNLGVKTVRPGYITDGTVWFGNSNVSISGNNTNVSGMSVVSDTYNPATVKQLRFDIYSGSSSSTATLDVSAGDLLSPSSLFTNRDELTYLIVRGDIAGYGLVGPGKASYGGLERRVQVFDGGNANQGETASAFKDRLKIKAADIYSTKQAAHIIDGELSKFSNKINSKYLGDPITMVDEYGVAVSLRVDEYTRTEDKNGENGYPTLVLPADTGTES